MLEAKKDNFDVEIQYSADNKCSMSMSNETESKDLFLGGSMVKMQH